MAECYGCGDRPATKQEVTEGQSYCAECIEYYHIPESDLIDLEEMNQK
jgi:hypothetical protein